MVQKQYSEKSLGVSQLFITVFLTLPLRKLPDSQSKNQKYKAKFSTFKITAASSSQERARKAASPGPDSLPLIKTCEREQVSSRPPQATSDTEKQKTDRHMRLGREENPLYLLSE